MPNQEDPPDLDHAAPAWFHKWVKDLLEYLKSQRVVQGLNNQITDTAGGGRRIDVGLVPANLIKPFPFQTFVNKQRQFRVNLGTINNLVPGGLLTWKTFTPGDAAVLSVTTNGKQVTNAQLINDTLPSTPDCTIGVAPTTFKIPLALLQDGEVQQIQFTNLAAIKSLCHQTERTYPINPVGSSPWINWWTWTVVPELTPQLFPVT